MARSADAIRLHRVFIDEAAALEVEDFGNSESLLKDGTDFQSKAQELHKEGALPVEHGWDGWPIPTSTKTRHHGYRVRYAAETARAIVGQIMKCAFATPVE